MSLVRARVHIVVVRDLEIVVGFSRGEDNVTLGADVVLISDVRISS